PRDGGEVEGVLGGQGRGAPRRVDGGGAARGAARGCGLSRGLRGGRALGGAEAEDASGLGGHARRGARVAPLAVAEEGGVSLSHVRRGWCHRAEEAVTLIRT